MSELVIKSSEQLLAGPLSYGAAAQGALDTMTAAAKSIRDVWREDQQRLTAAEQLNEALLPSKVTECRECGSKSLSWDTHYKTDSGVQQGRLRTHEVYCVFVLGCEDCSETLATVRAETMAVRFTAALNPTESGASDE